MNTEFQVGQRRSTPNGRTVEIVGVQPIAVTSGSVTDGFYDTEVEVVAYRFVGMGHVHIRKGEDVSGWAKLDDEF